MTFFHAGSLLSTGIVCTTPTAKPIIQPTAVPTKETIRDGSYPISSYFYAVTASPIGESAPYETNENIKAMLDWILSEQGQKIIEETGYVSLN